MLKTACAAALIALLGLFPLGTTVHAQDLSPRLGLGLNGLISTEDGVGLGLRGRASAPVNQDFSVAVDLGVSGFILGGREDATYVFDPQISAIVNLPFRGGYVPYLIGGLGAYVPLTNVDESASGPTIHFGIGRAQALAETSLYYEINPALLVGEESVDLLVPVRVGLIF